MAKKIPVRQCVGCGEMKNKKEMMRVLRTPEGETVLDKTGKKNGRGAYLCISKECLQKARKNKGLERSFKMSIPNEVYDSLEKEFDEENGQDLIPAVTFRKGKKSGQWRIYGRKSDKGRNGEGRDRIRGCLGEYEEAFP